MGIESQIKAVQLISKIRRYSNDQIKGELERRFSDWQERDKFWKLGDDTVLQSIKEEFLYNLDNKKDRQSFQGDLEAILENYGIIETKEWRALSGYLNQEEVLKTMQFLMALENLTKFIEEHDFAYDGAYKVAVMFGSRRNACNYLRCFEQLHPQTQQPFHDAVTKIQLPTGVWDTRYWTTLTGQYLTNSADDLQSNDLLFKVFPFASKVDAAYELMASGQLPHQLYFHFLREKLGCQFDELDASIIKVQKEYRKQLKRKSKISTDDTISMEAFIQLYLQDADRQIAELEQALASQSAEDPSLIKQKEKLENQEKQVQDAKRLFENVAKGFRAFIPSQLIDEFVKKYKADAKQRCLALETESNGVLSEDAVLAEQIVELKNEAYQEIQARELFDASLRGKQAFIECGLSQAMKMDTALSIPLSWVGDEWIRAYFKRDRRAYTLEQLFALTKLIGYHRVTPETQAFAQELIHLGVPENAYNRFLEVTQEFPAVPSDAFLPNVVIDGTVYGLGNYFCCKFERDPRALFLGYPTGCCQSLGSEGDECAKYGWKEPHSTFYIVVKSKDRNPLTINTKNIVGVTWAWRPFEKKGDEYILSRKVVFDSLEGNDLKINKHALETMFYLLAMELVKSDQTIEQINVGGNLESGYGYTRPSMAEVPKIVLLDSHGEQYEEYTDSSNIQEIFFESAHSHFALAYHCPDQFINQIKTGSLSLGPEALAESVNLIEQKLALMLDNEGSEVLFAEKTLIKNIIKAGGLEIEGLTNVLLKCCLVIKDPDSFCNILKAAPVTEAVIHQALCDCAKMGYVLPDFYESLLSHPACNQRALVTAVPGEDSLLRQCLAFDGLNPLFEAIVSSKHCTPELLNEACPNGGTILGELIDVKFPNPFYRSYFMSLIASNACTDDVLMTNCTAYGRAIEYCIINDFSPDFAIDIINAQHFTANQFERQDAEGNTILHQAVLNGLRKSSAANEILKALLSWKPFDPSFLNIQNNEGKTCLMLAEEKKNKEAIELIRSAMPKEPSSSKGKMYAGLGIKEKTRGRLDLDASAPADAAANAAESEPLPGDEPSSSSERRQEENTRGQPRPPNQ